MIYKGRPGGYFNAEKALFLMGSATCHQGEDIIDAFKTVNTDVKYMMSGLTPLLQFLVVYTNKPFKNHLKNMWEEWLDSGKIEFTKFGKRKCASYEMVASWIHQAWKHLKIWYWMVFENVVILNTTETLKMYTQNFEKPSKEE